jgi:ATP-dependent helicase/nuclease subunit A
MRERISKSLKKEIKKDPQNTHLLRQHLLLPMAHICTIDGFANELVRENFHALGIDPDFKILDDSDRQLLAQETANEVVEELYLQDSDEFKNLTELLSNTKNDNDLVSCIIRLFNYSQAYAFPKQWISDAVKAYDPNQDITQSKWEKIIITHIKKALEFCTNVIEDTLTLMRRDDFVYQRYSNSFLSDLTQINEINTDLEKGLWDSARSRIDNFEFITIGRLPNGYSQNPVKTAAMSRRQIVKDIIVKSLSSIMSSSSDEFKDDLKFLNPIVLKLFEAVSLFSSKFYEKKVHAGLFDFSDITHLAIKLLVTQKDGAVLKTELAQELSSRYAEILLDEYQDTNMAQDIIFSAISQEFGNIFMVGDVKQSIYRFRQAMPEIFLEKFHSFPPYEEGSFPAKITLGRNFRSRSGVVGMVNFMFSQLMSKEIGEVEYDQSCRLVYGSNYPPSDCCDAQIHIIDLSEKKDALEKPIEIEAKYIAQTISDMMKSTYVSDKIGGVRPVKYGDFCILMRSPRGRAEVYAKELSCRAIPAYTENTSGFFEAYETKVMLSLLRVIDNPVSDVALLSVMMSPLFAFSSDDAAQIRLIDREASIYECIKQKAANGDVRCCEFLDELFILRRLCAALPVSELIRRIYEQTGYMNIVLAMENGKQRKANLKLLLTYAENFDNGKASGLSGFIRFIDSLQEKEVELNSAGTVSEGEDVVHIMSIHKSKGLEFPICIIANCSGRFNKDSLKNNMILHPKLGAGLIRRNIETMHQYPTVMHTAAKLAAQSGQMSEEMRILYVAMTRACEKIINIISLDNVSGKLSSLAANILGDPSLPPFGVSCCKSYADWILYAALRHPAASLLRDKAGVYMPVINADFDLQIVMVGNQSSNGHTHENPVCVAPDPELKAQLESILSYSYPYAVLSRSASKRSASGSDLASANTDYFASSRPSFISKKGLTPAQRGTALHIFMNYMDFNNARDNLKNEIERIKSLGFLNDKQANAFDLNKVRKFLNSDLFCRIISSDDIIREKKFAINMPVTFFDESIPKEFESQCVLVQGMADLAFVENGELVIVDYKTDRIKDLNELKNTYKKQLEIYCIALSQCTNYKVKEALLYSFEMGETVKIDI